MSTPLLERTNPDLAAKLAARRQPAATKAPVQAPPRPAWLLRRDAGLLRAKVLAG